MMKIFLLQIIFLLFISQVVTADEFIIDVTVEVTNNLPIVQSCKRYKFNTLQKNRRYARSHRTIFRQPSF